MDPDRPGGPGADPAPDPHDGPDGPGPGNVTPTSPGALVGFGSVAMVAGWSIRPLSIRFGATEPVISVWSVVVVWVLALAVGAVALRTWRILQRDRRATTRTRAGGLRPPPRLEPYQAVNRLVLGKAGALAGAVVLGGYAGFAIAHLGITPTELSGQRLARSAVAALGGALLLAAGLLLERACRVRPDDS